MGLLVVGFDFAVHQRLDLVRIEVARHHHPQVVREELDHVVIAAHCRVFLEDFRLGGRFHIFLDGHQPLFAGLLQNVIEHCHELHVTRLGVLGALERHGYRRHRGLEHLGLVVDHKRAQRTAENRHDLEGERLQDHGNVAAVQDIHPEDAPEDDDVTDDDEHACLGSSLTLQREHTEYGAKRHESAAVLNVSDCSGKN